MNKNKKAKIARINGAQSKGPATKEGKDASRQNATKHGLLASKLFLLDNENPELFAGYLAEMMEVYQPANTLELDLVTEMVGARWRLRRLWNMEASLFELTIDTQVNDLAARAPNLPENIRIAWAFQKMAIEKPLSLSIRYEARIRRSFEQALANLIRIQKLRRETEAQAAVEAQEHAEMEALRQSRSAPNASTSSPHEKAALDHFSPQSDPTFHLQQNRPFGPHKGNRPNEPKFDQSDPLSNS